MAKKTSKNNKAENHFHQPEEWFRPLFESSPVAIEITDVNGNIIDANRAMEEMSGYDLQELKNINVGDTYFDINEYHRALNVLQKSDKLHDFEARLKRKDGLTFYGLLNIDKIEAESGTLLLTSIRDITERKEIEEGFKSLEELHSSILGVIPHAVLVLKERNIIFANNAVETVFGWKPEELKGKSTRVLYRSNKEYEEVGRHFYSVLKKKQTHSEEFPCRRKDGKDIICMLSASRIGASLTEKRIVAIYEDITEHKETVKTLQSSEQKYRSIFENAVMGIVQVAPEGHYLSVNPAIVRMYGYDSPEEMIRSITNMAHQVYVNPEDQKRLRALIDSHGHVQNFEMERYRKDGSTFWISVDSHAVRDKEGRVLYYVGTVEDITKRKEAEQALRKSEEQYRRIIETTVEGICVIDQDFTITFANKRYMEMLGYSAKEISGAKLLSFLFEEDVPDAFERTKKRKPGSSEQFERKFRRKDGSTLWVHASVTPMTDQEGLVFGSFAMYTDITERKQAEGDLKQTMEKLRKTLGGTIQAMSLTVESRDPYTAGHQRRVSSLARKISQAMGLSSDTVEGIRIAGIIHDIGKISVPAEILSKPTRLTEIEFSLIKSHSQSGYEILKEIDFPWPIAQIVLQHHERVNGSGYPQGLKDMQIMLEARILAVADVVEAISTHRPYRPAYNIDVALDEIEKNKGTLYDKKVVEICLKLFKEKEFRFQ